MRSSQPHVRELYVVVTRRTSCPRSDSLSTVNCRRNPCSRSPPSALEIYKWPTQWLHLIPLTMLKLQPDQRVCCCSECALHTITSGVGIIKGRIVSNRDYGLHKRRR